MSETINMQGGENVESVGLTDKEKEDQQFVLNIFNELDINGDGLVYP